MHRRYVLTSRRSGTCRTLKLNPLSAISPTLQIPFMVLRASHEQHFYSYDMGKSVKDKSAEVIFWHVGEAILTLPWSLTPGSFPINLKLALLCVIFVASVPTPSRGSAHSTSVSAHPSSQVALYAGSHFTQSRERDRW